MKNKILVKVIVPYLIEQYEIFIPTNERVSRVKELLKKAISDISDSQFDINKKYNIIDPDTGQIYENNLIIRETNIANSKKIILL